MSIPEGIERQQSHEFYRPTVKNSIGTTYSEQIGESQPACSSKNLYDIQSAGEILKSDTPKATRTYSNSLVDAKQENSHLIGSNASSVIKHETPQHIHNSSQFVKRTPQNTVSNFATLSSVFDENEPRYKSKDSLLTTPYCDTDKTSGNIIEETDICTKSTSKDYISHTSFNGNNNHNSEEFKRLSQHAQEGKNEISENPLIMLEDMKKELSDVAIDFFGETNAQDNATMTIPVAVQPSNTYCAPRTRQTYPQALIPEEISNAVINNPVKTKSAYSSFDVKQENVSLTCRNTSEETYLNLGIKQFVGVSQDLERASDSPLSLEINRVEIGKTNRVTSGRWGTTDNDVNRKDTVIEVQNPEELVRLSSDKIAILSKCNDEGHSNNAQDGVEDGLQRKRTDKDGDILSSTAAENINRQTITLPNSNTSMRASNDENNHFAGGRVSSPGNMISMLSQHRDIVQENRSPTCTKRNGDAAESTQENRREQAKLSPKSVMFFSIDLDVENIRVNGLDMNNGIRTSLIVRLHDCIKKNANKAHREKAMKDGCENKDYNNEEELMITKIAKKRGYRETDVKGVTSSSYHHTHKKVLKRRYMKIGVSNTKDDLSSEKEDMESTENNDQSYSLSSEDEDWEPNNNSNTSPSEDEDWEPNDNNDSSADDDFKPCKSNLRTRISSNMTNLNHRFTCRYCNKSTRSLTGLKLHQRTHGTNMTKPEKHQCSGCGGSFASARALKERCKCRCRYCRLTWESKDERIAHENSCNGIIIHKNLVFGRIIKKTNSDYVGGDTEVTTSSDIKFETNLRQLKLDAIEIQQEEDKHVADTETKCPSENTAVHAVKDATLNERKAEINPTDIVVMSENKHGNDNDDGSTRYQCVHCLITFTNKSNLTRHLYMHEKKDRQLQFACYICGKRQSDERTWLQHFNCLQRLPLYQCTRCGKGAMNDKILIIHQKQCTGKFYCSHCDAQFDNYWLALKHEKRHGLKRNRKGHICKTCGDEFQDYAQYRNHRKRHYNGASKACEICLTVCKSEYVYRYHLLKKHGKNLRDYRKFENKDWEPKNTNDSSADEAFKPRKSKVRRRGSSNMAELSLKYKCKHCNKSLRNLTSLILHQRTHGIKPEIYQCSGCGESYTSASVLKQKCKCRCKYCGLTWESKDECITHENSCNGVIIHNNFVFGRIIRKTNNDDAGGDTEVTTSSDIKFETNLRQLKLDGIELQQDKDKHVADTETNYPSELSKNTAVHAVKDDTPNERKAEINPHDIVVMSENNHGNDNDGGSTRYQCVHCLITFTNKSNLTRHLNMHDKKDKQLQFACYICGKRQSDERTWLQHFNCLQRLPLYQCTRCGKGAKNEKLLIIHQKQCTGKFYCLHCDAQFDNYRLALTHEKSHGIKRNRKGHICKTCGDEFQDYAHYRNHRKRHYNGAKICEICSTVYKSDYEYRKHLQKKHSENLRDKFLCAFCGQMFAIPRSLRLHEAKHEGKIFKKFTCDKCERVFNRSDKLKIHINGVHSEVRSHICCHCGKAFKTLSTLQTHERTHSGGYNYNCNICMKRFKTKKSVKMHQSIHTGLKTFKCSFCDKHYRTIASLYAHERIHKGNKQHTCDFCGKKFLLRHHLGQHLKTHTNERPYECSICGNRFKIGHHLTQHMATHGMKPRKR